MDAEWKKTWVEALRSGEYQQAQGALMDENGAMCCLGVLCYIQGQRRQMVGSECIQPQRVKAAGIRETVAETLAVMNDNGKSFGEIADFIEANL